MLIAKGKCKVDGLFTNTVGFKMKKMFVPFTTANKVPNDCGLE